MLQSNVLYKANVNRNKFLYIYIYIYNRNKKTQLTKGQVPELIHANVRHDLQINNRPESI